MRAEVHILCFNEEQILPYTLRHYATFCDKIVLHDAFSTDSSRVIARKYGAEVRDWHCIGVNDLIAKRTKEEAVMNSKADWCGLVDADEFLYFPEGHYHTLSVYEADGVAVVKTRGYEMLSDVFPDTEQQIYDVVKHGAADQKWYGKPILIAPAKIKSLSFGAGCHQVWAKLKDGSSWDDVQTPSDPPTLMLHYHHLGPVDRITRRYAGQQSRHSAENIKRKWGNYDAPAKHAMDKRVAITSKLVQVIQ